MTFIKNLVTSKYLAFIFRLYIGGLFLYASLYKINFPAEFAQTIASYQILPYFLVNLTAVFMPWLELICSILLILGIRAKTATLIICSLLVVFLIAIFINLIRDNPISCGCFHSLEDEMSWTTFFRDLVWLGMAVHVFYFDRAFHLEHKLPTLIREVEQ